MADEGTAHALLFTARRIARQGGIEDIFLKSLEQEGIRTREIPGTALTLDSLQNVYFAVIDGLHTNRGTQDKQIYERMLDYIHRQYAHDISLDQLSDYMQLSPSYVGLIFRRVGGVSFGKYVSDHRILKAKELLAEKHLTIKQVGERVGIENQNTFIRVFKKIEGVTPGQYREAKMMTHAPD
jgi:YesN/AraC family two-component response regulator